MGPLDAEARIPIVDHFDRRIITIDENGIVESYNPAAEDLRLPGVRRSSGTSQDP
jgi:nitrogen-specific signal transduction histidine kinase